MPWSSSPGAVQVSITVVKVRESSKGFTGHRKSLGVQVWPQATILDPSPFSLTCTALTWLLSTPDLICLYRFWVWYLFYAFGHLLCFGTYFLLHKILSLQNLSHGGCNFLVIVLKIVPVYLITKITLIRLDAQQRLSSWDLSILLTHPNRTNKSVSKWNSLCSPGKRRKRKQNKVQRKELWWDKPTNCKNPYLVGAPLMLPLEARTKLRRCLLQKRLFEF